LVVVLYNVVPKALPEVFTALAIAPRAVEVVVVEVKVPVTLPVVLPVTAPIKPFVDVTGPENVVDAMIVPYIQVGHISLYVVSRDCLMHRITPE